MYVFVYIMCNNSAYKYIDDDAVLIIRMHAHFLLRMPRFSIEPGNIFTVKKTKIF